MLLKEAGKGARARHVCLRLHAAQKSPQSLMRMEDRMCRKRARPSASTSAASRPISWSPPPRTAPGDSATADEEEAGDKDSGKLLTRGLLSGVGVGGWREKSGFACSPATHTVCAHARLPGQGGHGEPVANLPAELRRDI